MSAAGDDAQFGLHVDQGGIGRGEVEEKTGGVVDEFGSFLGGKFGEILVFVSFFSLQLGIAKKMEKKNKLPIFMPVMIVIKCVEFVIHYSNQPAYDIFVCCQSLATVFDTAHGLH